jgi:hypothetical protein
MGQVDVGEQRPLVDLAVGRIIDWTRPIRLTKMVKTLKLKGFILG